MQFVASMTDRLEHIWEEYIMQRSVGTILVVVYLGMIALIEINRQGWLPGPLGSRLSTSHFFAVEFVFTILLITEVVSLIFGLTRSFSRSIGIQLEILSLILLRDTFKKFTEFGEPLEWTTVSPAISEMAAEAVGALLIFVILQVYYSIQRGRAITSDETEQSAFIESKKLIALGLLITFITIGIVDGLRFLRGQPLYPFFETFYTVLIFTDVLMVLLSLRYSHDYVVTFRNFGYAIVTVFVRLTLIAPIPTNVLIGIGTTLFALAVAVSYNLVTWNIDRQRRLRETGEHEAATHPPGGSPAQMPTGD